MKRRTLTTLTTLLLMTSSLSYACSRMTWDTDLGTFVSRTEDWNNTVPALEVRPKGIYHKGDENHVSWTAKYASLYFTIFDSFTVEGFNEAGLSAGALSLDEESNSNTPINSKDLIDNNEIVNYILDNYSTVDEAIEGLKKVQLYQISYKGEPMKGHYQITDNTGDNVVLEMVNGKMNFYHDRNYTVMTNSPTYDKQLKNWDSFKEKTKGKPDDSKLQLPGNTDSPQRFIRNKFFQNQLQAPSSYINGIAKMGTAIFMMPQNIGQDDDKASLDGSEFMASYSLDKKLIHIRYQSGDAFSQFYVPFKKLNDGKSYHLNINRNPDLWGDVSEQFELIQ